MVHPILDKNGKVISADDYVIGVSTGELYQVTCVGYDQHRTQIRLVRVKNGYHYWSLGNSLEVLSEQEVIMALLKQ